jgi:hypothetical protein
MKSETPEVIDKLDAQSAGRLTYFEDCAAAINQLYQQALDCEGSKAFEDFLRFITRFEKLSVYNAMLVRIQRPGCAAVATRRQWLNKGRHVSPDARPILILQPFGPVSYVFEYIDTEGQEIPGETQSCLFAEGVVSDDQYKNTIEAAKKYGVVTELSENYGNLLAGTAAGLNIYPEKLAWIKKDVPTFRIRLNAKHDLPTRFATLAHELGHVYCGHVGGDNQGRWPDRSKTSSALQELEAEATAWLVCQRIGLKTRSAEYLHQLIKEEHVHSVNLYAIFDAAGRIEAKKGMSKK